jgi:hypothetical protein
VTAQAVKRAKFWLGYPSSACTPVFGQTLYEYLRESTGGRSPTRTGSSARRGSRRRRRHPARSRSTTPRSSSATTKGRATTRRSSAPTTASTSSRGAPSSRRTASSTPGHPSFRYAAVEAIVQDARANRNGLHIVSTPQPGDIACYSHNGDPYAHTGFYDHRLNDSEFVDLSGNTSSADFSNGGYVERHTRDTLTVTAFVRVT